MERIKGGNMTDKLEKLISDAERIGTIGSPSSTSELSLDILETAVKKKLVVELALFSFHQDGKPHYALGQITEVQLKNIWLEDPTMRSLARQRGQVNPVRVHRVRGIDILTAGDNGGTNDSNKGSRRG